MPASHQERILQGIGLALGQRAGLVLGLPLRVVLVLGSVGVEVGALGELLHLRQHVLGLHTGLASLDGVGQDGDGLVDGLLVLLHVLGIAEGLVELLGHGGHLDLRLQLLSLLAQIGQLVEQCTELQVVDVGIGTIVGQFEVVPDHPEAGVVLQAGTQVDRAVLYGEVDGLNPVLAVGERCRGVAHGVLGTGLQRHAGRLFVGEEHGQVLVVAAVLAVEALGGQAVDTGGSTREGLRDGERRVVGLSIVVHVVTTREVLVRAVGTYCPGTLVAVVAAEVRVEDQEGGIGGSLLRGSGQRSQHLLLAEDLPLTVGGRSVDVLAQHGRRAVVAEEVAVLSDGVVAILQLGNGQRDGLSVHVVATEVVVGATVAHLRLEGVGVGSGIDHVQRDVLRMLQQRSASAPVVGSAPEHIAAHVLQVVLASSEQRIGLDGVVILQLGEQGVVDGALQHAGGDVERVLTQLGDRLVADREDQTVDAGGGDAHLVDGTRGGVGQRSALGSSLGGHLDDSAVAHVAGKYGAIVGLNDILHASAVVHLQTEGLQALHLAAVGRIDGEQ